MAAVERLKCEKTSELLLLKALLQYLQLYIVYCGCTVDSTVWRGTTVELSGLMQCTTVVGDPVHCSAVVAVV